MEFQTALAPHHQALATLGDLETPASASDPLADSSLSARYKEHQAVLFNQAQALGGQASAREVDLDFPALGQTPEATAMPQWVHQDMPEDL